MTTLSRNARIAGLLYLMLMTAPLRLMYIPSKIIVPRDPAATASNILAHETLFRLGMLSDLYTATMGIFLTLALYRLFKDVDRTLAVVMVILGGIMVVPIYFLNTLNDAAALLLVRGAGYLQVFDKAQREALAMLFLRLHDHGVAVNGIFWGLWLVPYGLLVYKSRFLPRILGVWLVLNFGVYLAHSVTFILWPQYAAKVWNTLFPLAMGELAIMLWLLIMGARERRPAAAVAA
jgi:Domain of unknown function (DUF4386)